MNVTGQASILTSNLAEAWLVPVATAEHSEDEHMIAVGLMDVIAGPIVAATGFPIVATVRDIPQALRSSGQGNISAANATSAQNTRFLGNNAPSVGGEATRLYGRYTMGWVWN